MPGNYLRLIHWSLAGAKEKASVLRSAGYDVVHRVFRGPADLRTLRNTPPTAVVIDLTRLPSHGREIGLALRQYKATRHVPLVFVEGEREKVVRIKSVLPDAVYTTWRRIRSSLKDAIAHPPASPRVPTSVFDAYSGTPLVRKLGITTNSIVALLNAPHNFAKTLGPLPEGVMLRKRSGKQCDPILWFTTTRKGLSERIAAMAGSLESRRLWIAWPKKAGRGTSDLSQAEVRRSGLAVGLVDYKICSIDATWSGLLFKRRAPV